MIQKTLFALMAVLLAGGAQATVTAYCSNSTVCTGGTGFGASFAQTASDDLAGTETLPPAIDYTLVVPTGETDFTKYDFDATAASGDVEFVISPSTGEATLNSAAATPEALTLTRINGSDTAIGGDFFTSGVSRYANGGALSIAVTDASGTQTFLLGATSASSFVGFSSDSVIQSLVFTSQTATSYVTLGNFVAGTMPVAAVPEPSAYAMLLAGLGVLGLMRRRSA